HVAAMPEAQRAAPSAPPGSGNFKDALIAAIKKSKTVFYNLVVAQARIDIRGDRVTFSFTPAQRALKDKFEAEKAWLESIAQTMTGRKITMASAQVDASSAAAKPDAGAPSG